MPILFGLSVLTTPSVVDASPSWEEIPVCAPPTDRGPFDLPSIGLTDIYAEIFSYILGHKSEKSLEHYFNCWRKTDALQSDYLKKYKPMIQAAATATDIPFAVLACLFFRESQWDPKAASGTGALGFSQFLEGTWADQARYITSPAEIRSTAIASSLRTFIPKDQGLLDREVRKLEEIVRKNKGKPIRDDATLRSVQTSLAKIETAARSGKKAFSAKFYGELKYLIAITETAMSRRSQQAEYKHYIELRGKTKFSTKLPLGDESNRKDAEISIIFGALYLKHYVFGKKFGDTYSDATTDQWLIAAGAYNIGPGKIRCKSNDTIDACIIKMSFNEQNKEHMESIRNCVERGNSKPPRGNRPENAKCA